MKELIGKVVASMQVNQDQNLLKFTTNNGEDIIYATEGDCCSETWWADVIFGWGGWRESKFPFMVESEKGIEMPAWAEKAVNSDGKTRQEFDQIYGHKLRTNRGCIEIVYRNSSNGYYGGDYSLLDTASSWGNSRLNGVEWSNIIGDWSASNGHDGDDE